MRYFSQGGVNLSTQEPGEPLCAEAADEIERLQREVSRLGVIIRVNALRDHPEASHAEIDALIAGAP